MDEQGIMPDNIEEQLNEIDWLNHEVRRRNQEVATLKHKVNELKAESDVLRSDHSVRSADGELEMSTLETLLQKSQAQIEKMERDGTRQKRQNKTLKSQNLRLQYLLNSWGIPVTSTSDDGQVPQSQDGEEERTFFPKLNALVEGLDPIPVVLRGDLYTFGFPNLMAFLGNSNLTGVLTMVSGGIVSKLYLEKEVLRLAGWNNKDEDLSLARLLADSERVPNAVLERFTREPHYDLELAMNLLQDEELPTQEVQAGLMDHARVILAHLFENEQGAFFFQPGILRRQRYLQFNLPVLDILLATATEVDHRTRALSSTDEVLADVQQADAGVEDFPPSS